MEEHNYIRNIQIKKDLNILVKQNIMRKCNNFNYLKGIILEIIIHKNIINFKANNVKKLLNDKFGDIVINYKLIPKEIIDKYIQNYKKNI